MASTNRSQKFWTEEEEFCLLFQLATQNGKPDFEKVELPGRTKRAMMHRMEKLKGYYAKVVGRRSGEGLEDDDGEGTEEKSKKRLKGTHDKLPVVFPNLLRHVEKAERELAEGEEVEKYDEVMEDENDIKPTKIVKLKLPTAKS